MEKTDEAIQYFLKDATGNSEVSLIDFKDINKIPKDKIDFKKVRGSVRLMSGKVKSMADVEAMKRAFLALKIP